MVAVRCALPPRMRCGRESSTAAGLASEVVSNSRRLDTGGKPVYVIFDTGTTGFTMSRDLYEGELSATANRPRRKSDAHPWADVRVRFRLSRPRTPGPETLNPRP